MTDTTSIDRAALNNLLTMFNGDTVFLSELIATFLVDAANLLTTIQQAVDAGHTDELYRAAHSLKSNSASLGASALSGLCRELEELGRLGQLSAARDQLAAVQAELAQVKTALQKILAEGL